AARAPGGPAGWIKIPLEALKLMGSALPPVAMITLGLLVGQARLRHRLTIRAVAIPTIVRSLLTPLAVALLLIGGPLAWVSPVLALTIIIQASAPPATNLA